MVHSTKQLASTQTLGEHMTIPTRRKNSAVDPLNELSRAIGTLEGVVNSMAEATAKQVEATEVSSEAMRQAISALGKGLDALRHDVEALSGAVTSMKPTVERVAEARLIGRGMVMGIGLVAALTGSGVALILQKIFGGLSP